MDEIYNIKLTYRNTPIIKYTTGARKNCQFKTLKLHLKKITKPNHTRVNH